MPGYVATEKRIKADSERLPELASPLPQYSSSKSGSLDAETEAALDRRDAKKDALDMAKDFTFHGFEILRSGTDLAVDELTMAELPETEMTKKLLGDLAVAAVAAASGGIAGWAAAGISAVVKAKAASKVSSLVEEKLKAALKSGAAQSAESIADLKGEFKRLVTIQRVAAEQKLIKDWPAIKGELAKLSDADLDRLNELSTERNSREAVLRVIRDVFVQWANFLARAKHGGMGSWDHWELSGPGGKDAVALQDSLPVPSRENGFHDPSTGNVDPNKMGWALATKQRSLQREHFGVLEIFLYEHTLGVVQREGYGMRLDNVGPKVREELQRVGRVGDLPMNKLVRICSTMHNGVRVDPPTSIASILITADGYVRASHGFDTLVFEPKKGPIWDPMGFGDCMEDLIAGNESKGCHIDKKRRASAVADVAEVAQSLPLTYLRK